MPDETRGDYLVAAPHQALQCLDEARAPEYVVAPVTRVGPKSAATAATNDAGLVLPPLGTTADRAAEALVDLIRRHRLAPGAPMPSEMQTSLQLGVSRGIIREAYRSLSSAGIVEIANGRSPRVGRVTPRGLTQFLQHALSTRQTTAEHILELRQPIEERAAELAALEHTTADLTVLRRAVLAMRKAGARGELFVRADVRFHDTIGRATRNPLFGLLSSALREAARVSMRVSLEGRASASELTQVIDTHAEIVSAIATGDADAARQLMSRHFAEAHEAVRRVTALGLKRRKSADH